ncbi:hypothetical protein ILYODFUR_015977 [Ilyodon furcidens]|uniref:Uncharacterized protein n=1 Tax=Ilyodon furcidens TaxID=33524 RepID=A0ABV0UID2_9TELE
MDAFEVLKCLYRVCNDVFQTVVKLVLHCHYLRHFIISGQVHFFIVVQNPNSGFLKLNINQVFLANPKMMSHSALPFTDLLPDLLNFMDQSIRFQNVSMDTQLARVRTPPVIDGNISL